MRIDISTDLCQKLFSVRESQLQQMQEKFGGDHYGLIRGGYEQLQSIDGIHLWGTIGADLYLTFDGRFVLSEDRVAHEQSIAETCKLGYIAIGLVTGAFAYDLPEFLDFLPERPFGEPTCPCCQGARQVVYARGGHPPKQTCPYCCGLGWGRHTLD